MLIKLVVVSITRVSVDFVVSMVSLALVISIISMMWVVMWRVFVVSSFLFMFLVLRTRQPWAFLRTRPSFLRRRRNSLRTRGRAGHPWRTFVLLRSVFVAAIRIAAQPYILWIGHPFIKFNSCKLPHCLVRFW